MKHWNRSSADYSIKYYSWYVACSSYTHFQLSTFFAVHVDDFHEMNCSQHPWRGSVALFLPHQSCLSFLWMWRPQYNYGGEILVSLGYICGWERLYVGPSVTFLNLFLWLHGSIIVNVDKVSSLFSTILTTLVAYPLEDCKWPHREFFKGVHIEQETNEQNKLVFIGDHQWHTLATMCTCHKYV